MNAIALNMDLAIGLTFSDGRTFAGSTTIRPRRNQAPRAVVEKIAELWGAIGPFTILVQPATTGTAAKPERVRKVRTAIDETAAALGAHVSEISLQDAKRAWTGKGNASGEVVLEFAHLRGFRPASIEEAEALAMMHLATAEHGDARITGTLPDIE